MALRDGVPVAMTQMPVARSQVTSVYCIQLQTIGYRVPSLSLGYDGSDRHRHGHLLVLPPPPRSTSTTTEPHRGRRHRRGTCQRQPRSSHANRVITMVITAHGVCTALCRSTKYDDRVHSTAVVSQHVRAVPVGCGVRVPKVPPSAPRMSRHGGVDLLHTPSKCSGAKLNSMPSSFGQRRVDQVDQVDDGMAGCLNGQL